MICVIYCNKTVYANYFVSFVYTNYYMNNEDL